MADAASLRQLLRTIDGSAPAIESSAGSMMRHYDRSATVAVTEWRNALQTARPDQLLPLLYVANETLQNSKRNRGNKFLEAFSPILGQALTHICQADRSATEKVRRTVKIWGDRRVFSVRFVNELLRGLEDYRGNGPAPPPDNDEASFSPAVTDPPPPTSESNDATMENETSRGDGTKNNDDDDHDDILDLLDQDDDKDKQSSEDDDGHLFGSNSDNPKLSVQLDLDAAAASKAVLSARKAKRRRGSMGSTSSDGKRQRRRRSVLSANNLVDVWNRLTSLEQSFEHAQYTLHKIDAVTAKTSATDLEDVVGDELQVNYKQVVGFQAQISTQRQSLHAIAEERHALEQEAIRYVPWLEKALQQDGEDLDFCDKLEAKLISFGKVHGAIRQARDKRVEDERRQEQAREEAKRRRLEKEEEARFRQAALSKETEGKPGMVWNPVSREYQPINTDESWRDH